MFIPVQGQRLLTSDGRVWVVRHVKQDFFDSTESVISLLPEDRVDDVVTDTTDVFSSNWALWCDVKGVLAIKAVPNPDDEGSTLPPTIGPAVRPD